MMSNMLALLSDGDEPGTLFLCMFLCRLPEFMRCQLKAGRYETPDEMARAAEDLWEDATNINAAMQSCGNCCHHSPAAKSSGGNRGQHNRSPSPGPRRRLLSDYPNGNWLCPYHWVFGRLAKSCRPKCAWINHQGN